MMVRKEGIINSIGKLLGQDSDEQDTLNSATNEDIRRRLEFGQLIDPQKMIAILGRGVSEWNSYREDSIDPYLPEVERWLEQGWVSEPDIALNFSGANFEDKNLDGVRLENTILKDVNLKNARLKHANLSGATFDGTNLESANLARANISGIRLNHWIINDDTRLADCICDSILIRGEEINIPPGLRNWLLETLKTRTKALGNLQAPHEIDFKMEALRDYVKSVASN
jgi:hypothetical protein